MLRLGSRKRPWPVRKSKPLFQGMPRCCGWAAFKLRRGIRQRRAGRPGVAWQTPGFPCAYVAGLAHSQQGCRHILGQLQCMV